MLLLSPFLRRPLPPTLRKADWLYAFCTLWFTAGLFIDGWVHVHRGNLETFFTPWHGIFYAGFFACVLVLLARVRQAMNAGRSLREAIHAADAWSFIGVDIFLLGGIGDMVWHQLFGVEQNIEALLSPTHLMLATGMTLIVSRELRRSDRNDIAAVFSAILTILTLLFITQFGHYTDPLITGMKPRDNLLAFYGQGHHMLGMLLFAAMLIGILSTLLRRGPVLPGTATAILACTVLAMGTMRTGVDVLPAALIAGVVTDVILQIAEEQRQRIPLLRLACFLLPFVYELFVLLMLKASDGVWWTTHVWVGAPVMAGFAGLLTTFLVWPMEERRLR